MRAPLWVVLAGFGCRPPVLPPVTVAPSSVVDTVPAQARSLCIQAGVLLTAGDPAAALTAARLAARFDASAAMPWMLQAEAHAALGDPIAALAAATAAVEREPTEPELRWVRVRFDETGVFSQDDLRVVWSRGQTPPDRRLRSLHWLAQRAADREVLSAVRARARQRVPAAPLVVLPELMEIVEESDGALALVVGGLRLYRAGMRTEQARSWTQRGWAAGGSAGALWNPLPPEWRDLALADAPMQPVRYQRAPDDDVGWQRALDGHHAEALEQLSAMWVGHPNHPTVREQLWLVQRGHRSK